MYACYTWPLEVKDWYYVSSSIHTPSFIYLFVGFLFVCFESESLFETGAHWLARMAELWTPGFACLCCCAVVMNVCYSAWLLQGFWAPNLGPYACATSKYPAWQLPRSVVVFIYHICSCILLNVSHAVLLSVRWKANMNGMLDLSWLLWTLPLQIMLLSSKNKFSYANSSHSHGIHESWLLINHEKTVHIT